MGRRYAGRAKGLTKLYPQPGPQSYVIYSPVQDVATGGARGGGKSVCLLLDVAFRVERYGKDFHGLLVRRTYKEMTDLIRKGFEVLIPWGARWFASEQVFEWDNGASLHLGHLETEADAMAYQGHEFSWFGVDELGAFSSLDAVDALWGSMRSAAGVPVVRRSTINPGGPGHSIIKDRYLSHPVMKVFRYQPQPELAPNIWQEAVFIPSRLEDNPILMRNDPEYEKRLAMVGGPQLYKAWRFGDWDALAGQFFDCWNDAKNIQDREVKPWWPKWIAMDWGFSHDSAIGWFTQDDQMHIHQYREWIVHGLTPESLAQGILERTDEPIDAFYLSPDAFARRQSDRTIAIVIGEAMSSAHLAVPTMANNRRVSRKDSLAFVKARMAPTEADGDEIGGWQYMYQEINAGRFTVAPSCKGTVKSIKRLVHDPKHPENVLKSEGDDACLAEGTAVLTPSGPVPIENIRAGDVVITPDGTAEVIAARRTREMTDRLRIQFSNGAELIGTGNHPVLTRGRFKRLDCLRADDEVFAWREAKSSSSTVSSSGAIQTPSSGRIVSTTAPEDITANAASDSFIKKSGAASTEKSPRGCTSTTETEILSTTTSGTLNSSAQLSTSRSTPKMKPGRRSHEPISTPSETRPQHGIGRQRAATGTPETASALGLSDNLSTSLASAAENGSEARSPLPSSVLTDANRRRAEIVERTMCYEIASGAGSVSSPADSTALNAVPVSVRGTMGATPGPVYDLQTTAGVFIANGIVVSNSDMVRYALKSRIRPGQKPRDVVFNEIVQEKFGTDWEKLDPTSRAIHARRLSAGIKEPGRPLTIGRGRR